MTKPAHTMLSDRCPECRLRSGGPAARPAPGRPETEDLGRLKGMARTLLAELGLLEASQDLEAEGRVDFYVEVERFEATLIELAILKACGNQRQAARLLGMSASTLHGKLRRYGITADGQSDHTGDVATCAPLDANGTWTS